MVLRTSIFYLLEGDCYRLKPILKAGSSSPSTEKDSRSAKGKHEGRALKYS